ncbi:hypothetical protein N1851_002060 [Merluccius polli]|uniref:C-type lectin domain-containing protein n=1 Tax=Merluccius polli TaxID=89951 RepID=A0AA47P937_MERPO|nr:hypothetical protein N1851_002060 [Merluccius polli]
MNKGKKRHFTESELEIVVNDVEPRREILSGPLSAGINMKRKEMRGSVCVTRVRYSLGILLKDTYSVSLNVKRYIYYVEHENTWKEAQQYCQKEYIDLVALGFSEENNVTASLVDDTAKGAVSQVWIGLYRDPANISQWSWTETRDPGPSGVSVGMDCALLDPNAELRSALCSEERMFYCSPGNTRSHKKHTWDVAQQNCGKGALSTVKETNIKDFPQLGWVGLRRGTDGIWKWTGEPSDFFGWALRHPKNTDCGALSVATGDLLGDQCDHRHGFVCYGDNLVMVRESKTWEEALQHCRDLSDHFGRYDLLSSQYDHIYTSRHALQALTNEVWIGLRFLAGEWKWTDGDKLRNKQGLPHCAPQWKHCGTRHKYKSTLELKDCMEKRDFICYKE